MNVLRPFTFFALTALTVCLLAPASHAGPGVSGGGKGVICRTKAGKVRSAETLDLWEARQLYRTSPRLEGTVPEMVEAALRALSTSIRTDEFSWVYQGVGYQGPEAFLWALRTQAAQFFETPGSPNVSNLRKLRGMRLTLTDDSYEAALPANCEVEQIVNYQDEGYLGGTILLNQDLFEKLKPVEQAALIVHEALYKLLRGKFTETNSLRVRRAVGMAFTGHTFGSLNTSNLGNGYYECYAPGPASGDPRLKTRASRYFLLATNIAGQNFDEQLFVLQASMIDGIPMLDQQPVREVGPGLASVWYAARDFSDLSTIEGDQGESRYLHGLSVGRTQPEMIPEMRIEEAGPGGKLKVSLGANRSKLLPDGMDWRPATCEFHPVR